MRRYNELLGDLAGRAMNLAMSKGYLDFCQQRQYFINPPFFGPLAAGQRFFTNSQVNCNTIGISHVQGTAGRIHDDPDCPISYSLSINLSVVWPTTDLRYFWFPNLDVIVPLRPLQILIFQGVEKHTGTAAKPALGATTSIPHGYMEEVRYKVICYPNNHSIRGRVADR